VNLSLRSIRGFRWRKDSVCRFLKAMTRMDWWWGGCGRCKFDGYFFLGCLIFSLFIYCVFGANERWVRRKERLFWHIRVVSVSLISIKVELIGRYIMYIVMVNWARIWGRGIHGWCWTRGGKLQLTAGWWWGLRSCQIEGNEMWSFWIFPRRFKERIRGGAHLSWVKLLLPTLGS
jgi:hypothetical protein